MRHVPHLAIVIPEDASIASIGVYVDLMGAVNRYARDIYDNQGDLKSSAVVQLRTLGIERPVIRIGQGVLWPADGVIDPHPYDVVLLPAHAPGGSERVSLDARLAEWLRMQHLAGALIAASGASIHYLGQAGLLNGRQIAAPKWLRPALAARWPAIKLLDTVSISEDDGIFCAAQLLDDVALALRLSARIATPRFADWLGVQIGSTRSASVASDSDSRNDRDPLAERAKYHIHSHFQHPLKIGDIAGALGVSARTLARHFATAEGMTPLEYLHAHRITTAQRMLDKSDLRFDQIASLVGYSDISFFARLFKRHSGVSPRQWRLRPN